MKNQAKETAIENYEPQEQVIIPQSTREELARKKGQIKNETTEEVDLQTLLNE